MLERFHVAARPLAVLWTLAIVVGLSLPGEVLPEPLLLSYDKLIHLGVFLGFGLLWQWAYPHARMRILVAGVLFAVLSETYQHVMPINRLFSLADVAADLLGLAAALVVWPPLSRRMPGDASP